MLLKKMRHYFDPGRIVNLCFAFVLVSSTVLTWREAEVLEDAYAGSQQTTLDKAASALDRQMQTGVNLLLFYHNSMQTAMQTPLALKVVYDTRNQYAAVRQHPYWQINADARRTLSISGVGEAFVRHHPLLNYDVPLLNNEMSAALEMGYMMRLSGVYPVAPVRAIYVSRAGYFLSTDAPPDTAAIITRFEDLLDADWFTGQSPTKNPARSVHWFADGGDHVTASIPLDYQHYWYGTIALQFPLNQLKKQLEDSLTDEDQVEYQLFDNQFRLITASTTNNATPQSFSDAHRQELIQAVALDPTGNLRLGSQFISWQKLKHFDGV